MKKLCLLLLCLFTSIISFATPLPAEEVFQPIARSLDPNTFLLEWAIKPGYFLYKNRIKLIETSNSNFHLGAIPFPDALKKINKQGRTDLIYRNHLSLPVSILGEQSGEALLKVQYQGCADDGFCYPPQVSQIKLTIDKHLALSNISMEEASTPKESDEKSSTEHDPFGQLFSTHNWIIIIFGFFGFGLLLSFTPCVLPMVPVLSGIIVGHGHNISTRKAFLLSLSYVISMSITYAFVGAMVALMGSNLQILMQSPWTISIFSFIFVLLALSLFDVYELRIPVSWQMKLTNLTLNQAHGHYLGAAIMGCLSTLILSPCVTAPLIGALSYIAQNGNVVLGSLALFFLGLGMGTPLLLVGMSAGKLLPKAGHWMNAIKTVFGVMLLAVAIYLMQRILPPPLTMGLWASLLIFSGIFMGVLQRADDNHKKCRQSIGLILLGYGLLILIGASQGNSNPLLPLASSNRTENQINQAPMIVAKTLTEVQQAFANANGKPVILDFYADWCTTCKYIAATTLRDPIVQTALDAFVMVKVDLTKNNKASKTLLHYFDVVAPPTFLMFDTSGQEIRSLRLVGDVTTDVFLKTLGNKVF